MRENTVIDLAYGIKKFNALKYLSEPSTEQNNVEGQVLAIHEVVSGGCIVIIEDF